MMVRLETQSISGGGRVSGDDGTGFSLSGGFFTLSLLLQIRLRSGH